MKFPTNLPGGWQFVEPFNACPLARGQVWRKCGPSDAVEILRVMLPGHDEYDGGLPGISVRSSQIGETAVTWRKDTWFLAGDEQQILKRLETEGFARVL